MSVSMKPFDVQVHEINVKINTFKIGDGLIFGYVPRGLWIEVFYLLNVDFSLNFSFSKKRECINEYKILSFSAKM